ncbi:MAG: hypothetical protein H6706_03090 [Myxococcales bacterium]|nr:hypothetical protein [Myxococcales bacterium]
MTPDLAALLGRKAPADFSPAELMSKAHHRWSRAQPAEAAALFDAAAARAEALGDVTARDAARNRAAVTSHEAGAADAAERLEAVIAYYEAHPEVDLDRHFAEWAATALLERAFAADPACFEAACLALQARLAAAGLPRFPSIHPQQERLAELARDAEAREVMADLLPRILARKRTRALAAQVKVWAAWLAG